MTKLEYVFDTYNSLYFGNRLKPCVVYWDNMKPLGQFFHLEDRRYIRLNRKIKWSSRLWQFTLLHEMVHLKLVDKDHSKTDDSRMFNREMKKLAERGAFVGLW